MPKKYLLYIIVTNLVVLFGMGATTSATDAIDTVTITIPVSCTMSNTVDTAHSGTIVNGTYKADIGTTTFKTICNDDNGYSIYAIGYSDDTYGNTEMISSNSTNPSSTNIITGTATSGDTSNWAMKLTPVAGTFAPTIVGGYDNYSAIPATYTKVATFNSLTDNIVGSSVQSTYAVFIARTQGSGAYTGKVKYTIIHPNDGTAPTIPQPGLLGITNMQEMTPDICTASTIGDEKQLIDSRDSKSYWVTKLADGKCWMTQNLDLDLSTSTALTPSDSDVTSNWTPTRGTIDASAVTDNSISNWSNDNNTPYSVDPGNVYWNNYPFYTSTTNNFMANDWGSSPVKFQRNTAFSTNGEHGHVGNYYNWSAAVAMNSTSGYTSSTLSNPTANPQTSICPKGWRLPTVSNASYTTNGTTNEFARLANIYANYTGSTSLSSENLEKAPLYFVRSGYVYSSQQNVAGYDGYYWSSSVYSSSDAYYLVFDSSIVYPTFKYDRFYGFSVRCVAR
ncbi:hypothetical protein IKF57_00620 [Candidatus Saccharibacteria bacterium]|nr:hypothetical protein [Candidatus Saccharibacteria bacterium]